MLFKLYKNIFNKEPPKERRELFARLYQEHGVELIGVWQNKDNPLEKYMLTKYRDIDHYNDFIDKVKQIPEYKAMTKKVNEVRKEVSITDLIPE